MRYFPFIILGITLLIGCEKKTAEEIGEIPKEWRVCKDDADCTLTGVCYRRAVARTHASDTRNFFRAAETSNCPIPEGQSAACIKSRCEIQESVAPIQEPSSQQK